MGSNMQKEIQLTDKTLLVVGLPLTIENEYIFIRNVFGKEMLVVLGHQSIYLPLTGWQLLGIYPELTEEQASQVVEQYREMEYQDYGDPYEIIYYDEDTAKESFQSLMEREKCYTVNPYGEKPKFQYEFGKDGPSDAMLESAQDDFDYHSIRWHEAQQTTFDKYAILIKSK